MAYVGIFCPRWARDGRRTKLSLVSQKQNRKHVFRSGFGWKIEEPDRLNSNPRWRTMFALWKHERAPGSLVKRWMFDRLLTEEEAEEYGKGV